MNNNFFQKSYSNTSSFYGLELLVSVLNLIIRDEKGLLMENLLQEIKTDKRQGVFNKSSARKYYLRYKEIDSLDYQHLTGKEYKFLKEKYSLKNRNNTNRG